MCAAGFAGPACDKPVRHGTFYKHEAAMRARRTQHSMVFRRGSGRGDELWVFGGLARESERSADHIRSDVEMYSLAKQMWSTLRCSGKNGQLLELPAGRYGHTAVTMRDSMVVYGGRVSHRIHNASSKIWALDNAGTAVDEVWSLEFATLVWTQLWPPSGPRAPGTVATTLGSSTTSNTQERPVVPMAVHGHSATVIGDSMYVLGGLNKKEALVWQFLKFDALQRKWEPCSTRGSFPGGLFGHTAVYSKESDSMYVYGGRGRVRMTDGLIQKTNR